MMYTRGVYLGSEFKGKGAHIALGPVAGPLGRNALGGRNWEVSQQFQIPLSYSIDKLYLGILS